METSPFLPLTEGRVAGTRWSHRVHDLGVLRVPSGRLEASDPFVNLGKSFVVRITPGDYPVRVTVADVSDGQNGTNLREAYLSVVLREGTAVRAEALTPEGCEPAPKGEFYGVGVDAGAVGFGGDELEEHVRFGAVQGEVADFVDDQDGGAQEGLELAGEPAGGFGGA